MAVASQALINALQGTPDLVSNPSLISAAAQTDDPAGTGQALSQTTFATTLADNADSISASTAHAPKRGFWGSMLHGLSRAADATGVSKAAEYLNKPLAEVQHDYRYVRDVYHQHGFWAGLGETAAIVGVGAVATVASEGNLQAGILASELTVEGLAHTIYKDSYERTKDPNYMIDGHLVSPGRDLADALGLDVTSHGGHGGGAGHWVSGSIDAAFDIEADPLMKLGAISRMAKSGQLAEKAAQGAERGRMVAANNALMRWAPGQRIIDATQIDALRQAPMYGTGYRRALDDLASKTSPTDILKAYPDQVGLADRLAKADSAGAVHNVFRDAVNEGELTRRVLHNELPSRALMRAPLQQARVVLSEKVGRNFDDENGILKALAAPTPSNLAGLVSRKIRTFTNDVPVGINPETLKISSRAFDPTSPTAGRTIHQIFSTGMSPQLAKDWTDRFINADTLAEKKAIYGEGLIENAKAAGLADNAEYMHYITDLTRQAVHGQEITSSYGIGHKLGDAVNDVHWTSPEAGAVTDRQALFGWQADNMWTIPDYKAMRYAIADMSNPVVRNMAKLDEFARSKVIDPIFKPFALISAAFGMRVAASEAAGEILRHGAFNYLRSQAASVAARMQYKLSGPVSSDIHSIEEGAAARDEASHIATAAMRALGGVSKAIAASPEDIDTALRIVVANKGHFTTELANSGHNSLISPDGPAQKAADAAWYLPGRDKRLTSRFTDDYRNFTRADKNYTGYWIKALNNGAHEPSVQKIAQDFLTGHRSAGLTQDEAARYATDREAQRLRGIDPNSGKAFTTDPYAAEREKLGRHAIQDPAEFATHRVDTVRNYVTGADGTFHDVLARRLAAGKHVPHEGLLDKIPDEQRPEWLSGADEVPNLGPGLLQRITDKGFKVMVQPFVQNLSRNPLYFASVNRQLKSLKAAVEHGVLSDEEALTVAQIRGSLDMLPRIHNTYLRSQASIMMNNFLPFYFAQEQAMRRVGLVLSKNPWAVRGYQLEAQALNDPGFVHTDSNGNRTAVIPGAGLFGNLLLHGLGAVGIPVSYGLPLSFNGSMSSLDTVTPTIKPPGVSPFLAISLNTLEQYAPGMSGMVKAVEGPAGYNKSLRDELIPNTFLRTALKALHPDQSDRAWMNAYTSAIAAAQAHGQVPGPDATPHEKQAFLDRIKHNAQSAFFAKAVVGLFSPIAPQPQLEDTTGGQTWRDEFSKMLDPKSPTYAGGYAQALAKFQAEHGDKAVSYTIAKSESTTGVSVKATQPALDFLNTHEALLSGPLARGASFLTPQSGTPGDGQLVYNELLKTGLRARRTPQQFLDAIYTADGDRAFFAGYDIHKQNILALNPNDTAGLAAENKAWSAWVATQQNANPVWAVNFDPLKRKLNAQQAIQDLTELFSTGKAPTGEQTDLVAGLLDDYNRHVGNLAQIGEGLTAGTKKAENQAWKDYLDSRAAADPRVGNVIRTVFKAL